MLFFDALLGMVIAASMTYGLAYRYRWFSRDNREMAPRQSITTRTLLMFGFIWCSLLVLVFVVGALSPPVPHDPNSPHSAIGKFGLGFFAGVCLGLYVAFISRRSRSPKQPERAALPVRGARSIRLLLDWAIGATTFILFLAGTLEMDRDLPGDLHGLDQKVPALDHRIWTSLVVFLLVFAYTSVVVNAFQRQVAKGLNEYWLVPRGLQYLLAVLPLAIAIPIFHTRPGSMAGLGWHILLLCVAWRFSSAKPAGTFTMVRNVISRPVEAAAAVAE